MKVEAVSSGTSHGIGKGNAEAIRLVAGLGVEHDVHAGATVKHRSRVRKNPSQPNLRLGSEAVVEVKGLRNPCAQLDEIAPGLLKAVLDRDADGELVRKSGVMGVVVEGGEVRPGDPIEVELPPEPHVRLEPV